MNTILLQNQKFHYRIHRKKIRSLRLQITSKNSFSLSAPSLAPIFLINKFIRKHQRWIVKHASQFSAPSSLNSLTSVFILGQEYPIIFRQSGKNSLVISHQKQNITVFTSSLTQTHLKSLFQTRLKPYAKSLIIRQIDDFNSLSKFKYNRVTVRNQRSRFGSCSSRGNLNFNWQIIFFPPDKFRHIILHELVHLSIKNHSKKFWQTLTTYDPHSRANNLWLRQRGTGHYIIKP